MSPVLSLFQVRSRPRELNIGVEKMRKACGAKWGDASGMGRGKVGINIAEPPMWELSYECVSSAAPHRTPSKSASRLEPKALLRRPSFQVR